MSEANTLDVKILEKSYLISCPEDKKIALTEAAAHLDHKMREIRSSGKVHGVERIAVMAALNITHELLENNRDNEGDEVTLISLEKRMDHILSNISKS